MEAQDSMPGNFRSGDLSIRRIDWLYAAALAMVVAVSRIAYRGPLYFVDGPYIVNSIRVHAYVVQSPGYWVLAHLGGLFSDPEFGLAFWNITFSALGVATLYLLLREYGRERHLCLSAAVAYASTYFLWFAGEIHSSYASQVLFPPLSLLCFLCYRRTKDLWWVLCWASSSALGMAIRPSDGVFLLPLWLYLFLRYVRDRRGWLIFASVNAAIFLFWYIPTRAGLQVNHRLSTGSTIWLSMQTVSPLLTGINPRSLANFSRVLVPSFVAFCFLIPAIVSRRDKADWAIAILWMAPGLCFFLFCYVADPTYLVYLTGAVLWLAATCFHTRRALICLLLCAVFNAGLFLSAKPIREAGLGPRLMNFYVVKYCRYGIEHRWSSTVGGGARVP